MSFYDGIKDKYKKEREKAELRKTERRSQLGFIIVKYIGGFDEYKRQSGTLVFYADRLTFQTKKKNESILINSADVTGISVEGKDQVNKRVTVTRLIALNVFALAVPKKSEDKEACITIKLKDGREIIFYHDNLSPSVARSILSNAISRYNQAQVSLKTTPISNNSPDVTEQLERYAALKEKGIITQDEFNKKKSQLLN